jgi:hypothetical protein
MQTTHQHDQRAKDARSFRVFAGCAALTFAVTLAVIVGNRLSDQALAVLAGAVCGVGAAIPTSLLILAIARRRDRPPVEEQSRAHPQQGAYPPVIVVAPPGVHPQAHRWTGYPPAPAPPTRREFTMVGGSPGEQEELVPDEISRLFGVG